MKKKEMSDYERETELEIESRLSELEAEGYDYGKRFGKIDWIFVALAVLSGIGIIIMGMK